MVKRVTMRCWGVFLLLGPRGEGHTPPRPCLPRLEPTLLLATGLRVPRSLGFSSKDRKRDCRFVARSQTQNPNWPIQAPGTRSPFKVGAATPTTATRWRQETA